MHTIVFEAEWDSLATMAAFFEKMMTDPEMMAEMPKWEAVSESHEVELYMVMPSEYRIQGRFPAMEKRYARLNNPIDKPA
jgi:hypothetical protein